MKEILNKEDFKQAIEQEKTVLLDFYADWCGPCQTLLPIVEKFESEHADELLLAKVNVDKNPELSAHFKVRSIPSLFFIKDGQIVQHLQGLQTEDTLEKVVQQIQEAA